MDSGCDDINRDYLMATNDALKRLKKKDGRISEVFITKLVPGALSLYRALEMRSNGQRISAYACEALFHQRLHLHRMVMFTFVMRQGARML